MPDTTNIYGEIRSLDEFRKLYRDLREQIRLAGSRRALEEIKERSEYLATLADNPIWRDELDRGGPAAVEVALEEDGETTRLLNERARQLVAGGDVFRPWRRGGDSLTSHRE